VLIKKPSFLVSFIIVLVLAVFIVGAVLIVQRSPRSGGAQFTGQASLSFSETFETDTFKDAGATTAEWDTATGDLTLEQSDGDFYKADRTTLGADLVSVGSFMNLQDTQTIALDSSGFPNVVWNDNNTSKEVFFSRWDGSQWVKMDGTPGSDNLSNSVLTSHSASIALDANDRPHVIWSEDQIGTPELFDIYHVRWDGSAWSGMAGPGPDNVSGTAAAPDQSNDDAHVLIDAADMPHIAWTGGTVGFGPVGFEVLYASWTGSGWDGLTGSGPDNVTNSAEWDLTLSFALDSLARPAFAWRSEGGGLRFSRWNGSAYVMADGITPGSDNVETAAGFPTPTFYTSLDLDSEGQPYIATHARTSPLGRGTSRGDIYITRWDTSLGSWATVDRANPTAGGTNATGSITGQFAEDASMHLDAQDNPTLSFVDVSTSIEYFTRWNGSEWVQADRSTPGSGVVASGSATNEPMSHTLDSLENPALFYGSTLSPDPVSVFFTQWIEPCISPAVAQSLAVDSSADPILSATLVPDAVVFDGSIIYALSNDGGVTFENVMPGVPHVFTTAGSDLRWRATLAVGSHPGACPNIDTLTVDYVTEEPLPPVTPVPGAPGDTTQIFRVQGDDPVELAINTSKARFTTPGSAATVVLARSTVISDALAITPYANLKNASLLLTPSNAVPAAVMNEIARVLGAGNPDKTVYLAGGEEALSKQIETDLANAGFTSQFRFPGDDRRETARLIANQIMLENPTPVSHAFLSEDQAFPDTLGLGSIAGQKIAGSVRPILLTERGVPTPGDSLLTFLAEHPTITSLEIAGGEAAVPLEVGPLIQQQQSQIVTIDRSAGADRFGTNQVFNAKYYPNPEIVVLANGEAAALPGAQEVTATSSSGGLFSALLAGNFAAGQSAPLVITRRDLLPAPIVSYLEASAATIDTVYIVGSLNLISQAVEDAVKAIVD
jgi:hypothetical protein